MPSSVVTLESVDYTDAKVSGLFAVTVPGAVWRNRPAFGDLEAEIEEAIRSVVERTCMSPHGASAPCREPSDKSKACG